MITIQTKLINLLNNTKWESHNHHEIVTVQQSQNSSNTWLHTTNTFQNKKNSHTYQKQRKLVYMYISKNPGHT
jgi:hypothetical protein